MVFQGEIFEAKSGECFQQRILETTLNVVRRMCVYISGQISERDIPEGLKMTFLRKLLHKIFDFSF